jgi:hypothetical protein
MYQMKASLASPNPVHPVHQRSEMLTDSLRMIVTDSMLEIVAKLMANPRPPSVGLTREKAAEIRHKYPEQSLRALGREYGVSQEAVRQVVLNRTWRDPNYTVPAMPRRGRPADVPPFSFGFKR